VGLARVVRPPRPPGVRLDLAPGHPAFAQPRRQPRLAISIYDSTVVPDDAAAVYVEAEGAEVTDAGERAALLEVFTRRSVAQGLGPFGEADVTGAAPHRLYRARALATFILGPRDQRIEVA
jgi:hypothetical protein